MGRGDGPGGFRGIIGVSGAEGCSVSLRLAWVIVPAGWTIISLGLAGEDCIAGEAGVLLRSWVGIACRAGVEGAVGFAGG